MPTPTDDNLVVTPASSWQTVEGFPVKLPSGNVARMKRTMDIITMVKSGRIPNPLAKIVLDAIRTKGTFGFDMENMEPEAVPQLFGLIDDVAIGCMLEPRVERPYTAKDETPEEVQKENDWRPSPGAISLKQLDEIDKMFLFRVAMGGTTDLESFRSAMESSMATSQDGQVVQQPAKRPARTAKGKSRSVVSG
jgi:hypothetical protein